MTELLLVRHCESRGQEPGALLTDAGLRQAADLAGFLMEFPVDVVVCSPFRRALQSIIPYVAQRQIPVEEDDRLVERRLSAEPLDDWYEQLRRTWQDFDYRAPGGETSREAQTRARETVDEVAERGHGCPVLVGHGNWIGLVLNSVDPGFGFEAWERLSNPDVFRLTARAGGFDAERVWRG